MNDLEITFGSLFAGIGGFDLGFERAGMVCKWQVEIDDYANRVLAKHWPNVHRERDIRECGAHNLERVDVICGGVPCQDISYAGQGAGLDGERSGLFFEAVRVVRELRPRIIVLENVAALLTRGLDRVLGTLAEIGFDAEWHCIPAAAVGAPHIRDRVFVIGIRSDAISTGAGDQSRTDCGQARECSGASKSETLRQTHGAACSGRLESVREDVADANREDIAEYERPERPGRHCQQRHGATATRAEAIRQENREACNNGTGGHGSENVGHAKRSPTNIFTTGRGSRCSVGKSSWWFTEPDVGRVANGVSARVDRLRGLGNAVVPQVAEWIGRRIATALRQDYYV